MNGSSSNSAGDTLHASQKKAGQQVASTSKAVHQFTLMPHLTAAVLADPCTGDPPRCARLSCQSSGSVAERRPHLGT